MDFQTIKEMNPAGIHLANAFSINMLNSGMRETSIRFKVISKETAQFLCQELGVVSHIGHADMANVVSAELGMSVPMVRDTHNFSNHLLVAQYSGPRLPEGTTVLPEGSKIEWWLVEDHIVYA